ncbi:MAG: YicC/YloC family endoribonuclease [Betaproteobacteria bacterium]
MISSMTGYAAASADTGRGALAIELRSVNGRFLDLSLRVAEELRGLEPLLREAISARLARGKVDCRVFFSESSSVSPERLDAAALARLKRLAEEAARAFPGAAPLRIADVLRWPGVVAAAALDEGEMRAAAERLCRDALEQLVAARRREGAKLAGAVAERVAAMRRRIEEVAPLLPEAIQTYQNKIGERLREALGTADDERIRAEVALFAARSDVGEEIDRLRAHLAEVERTLAAGGAAGKQLDFLAQELHREANTLGAKAANQALSDCALELKLLVEQVREQVQNIE